VKKIFTFHYPLSTIRYPLFYGCFEPSDKRVLSKNLQTVAERDSAKPVGKRELMEKSKRQGFHDIAPVAFCLEK
jgi:hypothetical protein